VLEYVDDSLAMDQDDRLQKVFYAIVFLFHFEKFMKSKKPSLLHDGFCAVAGVLALSIAAVAQAADPVAAIDRAFVGKVSQGGRFEVEAGELAQTKSASQDVKDFAAKDVADHNQVNAELQSIASAQGLPLAPKLNRKFQKKLASLAASSGASFDRAYVSSMSKIHIKDEDIFAKEAADAASPDWKAFAAKTDGIVRGHIVALYALQARLN
jgi:putative membrane protein